MRAVLEIRKIVVYRVIRTRPSCEAWPLELQNSLISSLCGLEGILKLTFCMLLCVEEKRRDAKASRS